MNKSSRKNKKIRKGDKVMAISGNFRGQTGVVIGCSGEKIVVQGLNLRKKHTKGNEQNPKGAIIELEKPIHVSNLRVCIGEDTPVKLRTQKDGEGNRQLVYHENGQEVVYRSLKHS
jgi:large subunit ribosomal protein L24